MSFGHGVVDRLSPCEKLQKNDTKAVDIALLSQLSGHSIPERSKRMRKRDEVGDVAVSKKSKPLN